MIDLVKHLAAELIALLGIALIAYGAWSIYPPSAYIFLGAIAVLVAVTMARSTPSRARQRRAAR